MRKMTQQLISLKRSIVYQKKRKHLLKIPMPSFHLGRWRWLHDTRNAPTHSITFAKFLLIFTKCTVTEAMQTTPPLLVDLHALTDNP